MSAHGCVGCVLRLVDDHRRFHGRNSCLLEGIHAFWKERGWSDFFIDLLTGILYIVVGFMMVANPGTTAVALMVLIAMFLIFGFVLRIAAAASVRYPNWGWVLLHGFVNLLLVILIWRQWPQSRGWGIGLFVGIEMTFNGWSLVVLGLRAKNLPVEDEVLPSPSS